MQRRPQEHFKNAFTMAPVLKHPDRSRQFTVEVDTSDVGVGAILSQQFRNKPKLHPMALFSHKLSPTERNYDVVDRVISYQVSIGRMETLDGGSHTLICDLYRPQELGASTNC